MMLRIQKERLAGFDLDLAEFIARYQLSQERLKTVAAKTVVMHPGPIIRGLEIAGEVADGAQSAIEEQVARGWRCGARCWCGRWEGRHEQRLSTDLHRQAPILFRD